MVKIVIVEDDPLISRMYNKAFTFEGYEVIIASDGEEALAKIKSEMPTMVLLDVMMPKMNGIQVLDELKKEEATKGIPVVMLTNLAGDHDVEVALSKGAIKYIVKSEHTPKEVVDMIREILSGYTRDEIPGS